jgi:hypothetical protein
MTRREAQNKAGKVFNMVLEDSIIGKMKYKNKDQEGRYNANQE